MILHSENSRRVPPAAVAVVAAASLVAVAVLAFGVGGDQQVATVPITAATSEVASGDLIDRDTLDGSLESTGTLTVIHRIEGQTGVSSGQLDGQNQTGDGEVGQAALTTGDGPGIIRTVAFSTDGCATTTSTSTSTSTSSTSTTGAGEDTTTTTGSSTTTAPDCGEATTTTTTTGSDPGDIPSDGGSDPTRDPSMPSGGSLSGGPVTGEPEVVTELVTSVAAAGELIGSGDVLYTVEGEPVIALTGSVPAWRSLSDGVEDGVDVIQLEAALAALGYDPDGSLSVDATFDDDTAAVVEAWQEGTGREATGEVELGDVVFVSGPAEVTEVGVAPGDEVGEGSSVLGLDTAVQRVVVSVPAELRAEIVPGLEVTVDEVTGRVERLATTSGDDGVAVVAYLALDQALDAPSGASVTVRLELTRATGVFSVPAEALVSRLDGSYAVQLVSGDGTPGAWLTVVPGAVSGGDVEITGDGLEAGVEVVVPD